MVCGLFARNVDTLLPKKVPKEKTRAIPRKVGDLSLSSIKLYYSKRCEISYSIITKMTSIIRKSTKNGI